MKTDFDLKLAMLAGGVMLGLLAVVIATLTGHGWSIALGIAGVVLAIRSGVALAKRLGAADQPQ